MQIRFQMEKTTKNTVRFSEVADNGLTAMAVGTLYVPKATLADIGWESGDTLIVSLSVEKDG